MNTVLSILIGILAGLSFAGLAITLSPKYRPRRLLFGATVRKYDVSVTPDLAIGGAISMGLLYGLSGGVATLATNLAGAFVYAIGFAVTSMTAADSTAGRRVALSSRGILDLAAANIEGGALTAGAPVYLHTAGMYTSTRPTTNGTLLQQVGIALSTTRILADVTSPMVKVQTAGNSNVGGL